VPATIAGQFLALLSRNSCNKRAGRRLPEKEKATKPKKPAKEPITHKDYSLVRFLALYLINFRAPLLVSTLVNLFKFQ
jgi:hypothetical protein